MAFVSFMQSPAGRGLRIVLGAVIVAAGVAISGPAGIAVAVAGAVPLGAGLFGICLAGPLLGVPFTGRGRDRRA